MSAKHASLAYQVKAYTQRAIEIIPEVRSSDLETRSQRDVQPSPPLVATGTLRLADREIPTHDDFVHLQPSTQESLPWHRFIAFRFRSRLSVSLRLRSAGKCLQDGGGARRTFVQKA